MVVFRALELLAFGVFGVGGPTHEGGASGLETARTMCFWTSTRISLIKDTLQYLRKSAPATLPTNAGFGVPR